MTTTDYPGAKAEPAAGGGTDLSLSRTVTDHDHQLLERHFARATALKMGACVAAWALLAISMGSKALARAAGAYDFQRAVGSSVTDAVDAAVRAGGLGIAGAAGILLFVLPAVSRGFGHFLEVWLNSGSIPLPWRREGVNVGPATVRLEGGTLHLDRAEAGYRLHLTAYRPARRAGPIVLLPLSGHLYVSFVTDSARDAAAWVRALKAARRSAGPDWALPQAAEGWSAFTLDPATAEGLLAGEERRAGRDAVGAPDGIDTGFVLLVLAAHTLAAGVLMARGSWEGLVPAAVALLLAPLFAENLKLYLMHLRARRRGFRFLGLSHGLGTGPAAVRADASGIEIARPQDRTRLSWGGVDSVTEREGWLLVMSGGRILEILPPLPEIRSAMKAAGLIRRGGPWGDGKEDATWQVQSAA
jgi:hypothetical protein